MFKTPETPQEYLAFEEAVQTWDEPIVGKIRRELIDTGGTDMTDTFTEGLADHLHTRYGVDLDEARLLVDSAAWKSSGSQERLMEIYKEVQGGSSE